MSKGSKIYKRFGLKFAIAHRSRKIKTRIKEKPFAQQLQMFLLILKLNHSKKFRVYSLLRKQNCLITSLKHLEFIALCFNEIIQWLESKEFQEQYLDTNHPYPPLLNPKRLVRDSQNPYANLSYENISAELAWEMNLPLPPYYDLIWLRLDGSGSSAYGRFIKLCGINKINADDAILNNKIFHYYPCYQQLLAHKDSYNLIAIHEYWHESYMKFCALIDKNVPAICNIRDQIERLKHGVNHLNSWECAP
ncbi:hypothetical protein [Helicobacter sp. MIT 05-5294]|uniref:hypothetical protein n=1 Tax=Helicobacter sp. MIT 05-5294 TaxID=1548150 RepID=UPI0010FDB4E3|nr:hypothetical protein [Helicobacter sp. MIT 05-5294]TLD85410.1 hypothetical protein LS69_009705 [Helicobacter sp. MIT 05-5294]